MRRYSYPYPCHHHTPAPFSPSQSHHPAGRPPLCRQTHLNHVNPSTLNAFYSAKHTFLARLPRRTSSLATHTTLLYALTVADLVRLRDTVRIRLVRCCLLERLGGAFAGV